MSKWTEAAIRIQSIAQAGLAYGENEYDRERYEELRKIAAEMISCEMEIPVEKVTAFFCNETGYQTPKVDTRAAVFENGKILLVHEKNDTWSLPGGWCDVDQSVASNVIKETREEAGLSVTADKLIAVQDWRKHNKCNLPYGVVKIFVLCTPNGGSFHENIEQQKRAIWDETNCRHSLPWRKPQQSRYRCALMHMKTKTGRRNLINCDRMKRNMQLDGSTCGKTGKALSVHSLCQSIDDA